MTVPTSLQPADYCIENRFNLSSAATPKLLRTRQRDNWFYFPHSYSPELVETVLDDWQLARGSAIVDPFVGAGTTLLTAKRRGYAAIGLDISPLSVLVSNVKVADYDAHSIERHVRSVVSAAEASTEQPIEASPRLIKAFTRSELTILWNLQRAVNSTPEPTRGLLLVGLVSLLPRFSRAVSNGGWFRWIEKPEQAEAILPAFMEKMQVMVSDIVRDAPPSLGDRLLEHTAILQDARTLADLDQKFDGLITSPPYPNRHDYTRIFQLELLFLGLNEESIFPLRYTSLRSHVEAHAPAGKPLVAYRTPELLRTCLDQMPTSVDKRVPRMLEGYFEDMFGVLCQARRIMKPGGRLAFVVGNVRHFGVAIPVDEILALLGEDAGVTWTGSWVLRLRGNSAQQMGKYGRVPSRETIVFFQA